TPNGCATCRPALNYYLISTWPHEAKDDPQSRFINERAHANIQKDGTFSVVPRIWGGETNSSELRRIADVVDKYQIRTVKVTGCLRRPAQLRRVRDQVRRRHRSRLGLGDLRRRKRRDQDRGRAVSCAREDRRRSARIRRSVPAALPGRGLVSRANRALRRSRRTRPREEGRG